MSGAGRQAEIITLTIRLGSWLAAIWKLNQDPHHGLESQFGWTRAVIAVSVQPRLVVSPMEMRDLKATNVCDLGVQRTLRSALLEIPAVIPKCKVKLSLASLQMA